MYNLRTESNSAYDSKVGFNLGLLGHIHLSKQIALQPEIVYSTQGAKVDFLGTDAKINLDYINLPVIIQYMFNNGFRLQAGPQLGILVSANRKIGDTKTDIKDGLKSVDLGLTAGLGYVHPQSGLGVDVRYNLGLSNVNEDNNNKVWNRGMQLGLFYLFNHKN